jgi:hypothetical protein
MSLGLPQLFSVAASWSAQEQEASWLAQEASWRAQEAFWLAHQAFGRLASASPQTAHPVVKVGTRQLPYPQGATNHFQQ